MDSNEHPDDRELEMIRLEMERKRASLADKLGTLESQVLGTVQSATDAVGDAKEVVASVKETLTETAEAVKGTVTDTVSSVKETLSDTVSSVADTLNVSRHVREHPWPAMGGAVATGFLAGLLFGGSRREQERDNGHGAPWAGPAAYTPAPAAAPAPPAEPPAAPEGEGLGSQVLGSLGETWERLTGGLQGLAVASVLGLVREMATSSLPGAMHSDVGRFLDDLNDKLGGKKTELSQSVVGYVSEAVSSNMEEGPAPGVPASGTTSREGKANEPSHRAQHHNGPRPRAASGR